MEEKRCIQAVYPSFTNDQTGGSRCHPYHGTGNRWLHDLGKWMDAHYVSHMPRRSGAWAGDAALADGEGEAKLADGLPEAALGEAEADDHGLRDRLPVTALAEVEGVIGLTDAVADAPLGDAVALTGLGEALTSLGVGAGWPFLRVPIPKCMAVLHKNDDTRK